jgi:phage-related minor tail protein
MATVEDVTVQIDADVSRLRKEVKTAERNLGNFEKKVGRVDKSTKKLSSSFKNAASSAAIMEGPLGGVAGRLSALGSAFGSISPAIIAFGAAASAATIIMKQSIGAASQLERQMFKMEAVVKSTGGAAGFTAKELDEMARALDATTLASAAGARDAAVLLATFRSIGGEAFPRTLKLAQDLAAVMGTSLTAATLQLGKALEDPATGLTALKRSGVSFTEAERDVIKSLQETGKVAEAQGLILDKLAGQVGGAGKGEAGGLAGQADSLAFEWNNLMEAIGDSGPLQATTVVVEAMANAVKGLKNIIDPSEETIFDQLIEQRRLLEDSIADPALFADILGGLDINIQALKRVNEEIAAIEKARQVAIKASAERQKAAEALRGSEIAAAQAAAETKAIEEAATKRAEELKNTRLKLIETIERQAAVQKLSNRQILEGDLLTAQATEKQIAATLAMFDQIEAIEKQQDLFDSLSKTITNWGDNLADQMSRGKVNFSDFAQSIIQDMAKIVFQQQVTGPIVQGLTSALSGAFSGGGSAPTSAFEASRFANGGRPDVGVPAIVGERGPELFIPDTAGTVVPAGETKQVLAGGGSGTSITQHINVDARGATPGMENKIRQAVVEGARMGYELVAQDFATSGPIRGSLG